MGGWGRPSLRLLSAGIDQPLLAGGEGKGRSPRSPSGLGCVRGSCIKLWSKWLLIEGNGYWRPHQPETPWVTLKQVHSVNVRPLGTRLASLLTIRPVDGVDNKPDRTGWTLLSSQSYSMPRPAHTYSCPKRTQGHPQRKSHGGTTA